MGRPLAGVDLLEAGAITLKDLKGAAKTPAFKQPTPAAAAEKKEDA